jgi:hypothetical protein
MAHQHQTMDDDGYANSKELALLALISDGNHRPTPQGP